MDHKPHNSQCDATPHSNDKRKVADEYNIDESPTHHKWRKDDYTKYDNHSGGTRERKEERKEHSPRDTSVLRNESSEREEEMVMYPWHVTLTV
jgi:hypothetical protein